MLWKMQSAVHTAVRRAFLLGWLEKANGMLKQAEHLLCLPAGAGQYGCRGSEPNLGAVLTITPSPAAADLTTTVSSLRSGAK